MPGQSGGLPPVAQAARLAAAAALALALLPGAARAQSTDVTIRLTPAQAPLLTGVTHGLDSTLSVDVVNTNDQRYPLRHITFRVPTGYALRTSSRGPAGWATTINGREVLFQAPCSAPGIPAGGATGTFLLDVTPPGAAVANDVNETLEFVSLGDDFCSGDTDWYANARSLTFVRRVLRVVSGAVTDVVGDAGRITSLTVAWSVQNRSSQRKRATMTTSVAPALNTPNCPQSNIDAGQTGTVNCTYSNLNLSSGAYTFAARAEGSSATSVGTTFAFSFGLQVQWPRPVAVTGRPPHELSIVVVNNSPVAVTRVQVSAPAGWSGASALSGTGGLGPGTGCTAGTACFTGSLAERQPATLRFQFTGAPAVSTNTQYTFQVVARRGTTNTTFSQPVTLVAPLGDVAGLTVLSDAGGQVLSWTNTGRADSAHDGVVVFRATAPAVPLLPQDFVNYATTPLPAGVVLADSPQAATRDLADPAVGRYNYRVCNRDAFLVYSGCRSGFWNLQGYADSAEAQGAWTHQIGGQSLLLPTVVQGDRVAFPTNRPAIDVLDLATGHRLFDPVALPALPSSSTPATRTVNGRLLLFAADQSGTVTAVDLETGAVAWQKAKAGESFVAGVSGITRSYGGPAFQAAYAVDLLLLGSATTGNVLAIDATTGATLWTVNAGAPVRALVNYDSAGYRFYVPTSGGGVVAYDMTPSGPTVPAARLAGWQNPGGSYSLYCARTYEASSIACIDRAGLLRVLDGATGAVRASRATGLSSPSTLVRVAGATPGFVVGDGSQVQRLVASGTPTALSSAGTWAPPSGTISSALILSVSGYVIVASSDGSLHKLGLSDAHWISRSAPVPAVTSPRYLGPIAYDPGTHLFVFGSSEGRIWAIPDAF